MILTYKIRHDRDFSDELRKARKVAEFAVRNRTFSSKDVKHIGLKSAISNQILRKYGKNKNIKRVKSVNLVVPNQGIKVDMAQRRIHIPCLQFEFNYQFPNKFTKINQIEISPEYAFVSVTVPERAEIETNRWIGVDLNTTGHIAVVANTESGNVLKLGKKAEHIHKKYRDIRKTMQKGGKYRKAKQLRNRESRVVKDLNHKISRKIVEVAEVYQAGIHLENLASIRKAKHSKSFRYSLNSWSFYQLQKMIEYKAKLLGIPVAYIDPRYTSQRCSRCQLLGHRQGKIFKCPYCGHVDHADANAAFNIAQHREGVDQSSIDRDMLEGSTDTPKEAPVRMQPTSEPQHFSIGSMSVLAH